MNKMHDIEKLRQIAGRARATLTDIRGLGRSATEAAAKLDRRLPPAVLAEEAAKLRTAATEKARALLAQSGLEAELAAGRAAAAGMTRRAVLAGARFTPVIDSTVLAGGPFERAMLNMQAAQLEQITALRWRTEAPGMSEAELGAAFNAALAQREYALAHLVLTETEHRAERSRNGTDAELLAGQGVRQMAHGMTRQLEAAEMPGVTVAEALAHELRLAGEWLNDAVAGIETGDDRGLISQTAFDLRDAPPDKKQAAMEALRAQQQPAQQAA